MVSDMSKMRESGVLVDSASALHVITMEPTSEHHKKTLYAKRSFGKYPHPVDSPTYDAQVLVFLPIPFTNFSHVAQKKTTTH